MDNLRDVVDDFLHVLENLKEEQRDFQDGQRHLRDNLQNAMRQLQECLAEHGNLQNRQDDLQNAVRMVQETIAELIRSYDDQKMERNLFNEKLVNLEDKFNKALQEGVRVRENINSICNLFQYLFKWLTLSYIESYFTGLVTT